jgi:tetratricopeptide (TPR) repeat protein
MDDRIQDLENRLAVLEADPLADLPEKIDVMNELAWELRHFDPHRALALSKNALNFAEKQNYPQGQFHSLRNLAALNTYLFAKYDVALSCANEALDLLEVCSDKLAHAHILECIGTVYSEIGDYATAHTYLTRALALCRQVGDQQTESMLLNDLGIVYIDTNDLERGLGSYEQALEIAQTIGDLAMQARMMNNIGDMLNRKGRYDESLPYLEQSLALIQDLGTPQLESLVLDSLSEVYIAQGNYDRALGCLQQAYERAEEFNNKYGASVYLRNMARVYQRQQKTDVALASLHRALAKAEEINGKLEIFTCHQLLAEIYEAQREPEKALFHYKQYFSIKEGIFNEKADQKLKTLQVIHETETAKSEAEMHRLKNVQLEEALAKVKKLSGLLPICANCKKIRDDDGYWHEVEIYVRNHADVLFSHGICPDCGQELYPEYWNRLYGDKNE